MGKDPPATDFHTPLSWAMKVGVLAVTGSWLAYTSFQRHQAASFFSELLNRASEVQGIAVSSSQTFPYPKGEMMERLKPEEPYRVISVTRNGAGSVAIIRLRVPQQFMKDFATDKEVQEVSVQLESKDPTFDFRGSDIKTLVSSINGISKENLRMGNFR